MDVDGIPLVAAIAAILNSGVRFAVPVALAGAGEAICEKAGVLNLGLEGVMLIGALSGFLGAYYTGSIWIGLVIGIVSGGAIAAVFAFLSINLKTDQVINGIAMVLLAQGMTSYAYGRAFGSAGSPPQIDAPGAVDLGVLSSLPVVGRVFFQQTPIVYLAVALVAFAWWIVYRTRFGLYVRAVGEDPSAAAAAGVDVALVRWWAVLVCGGFGGLGGAMLVIGQLQHFQPNITAGQGWIAIALVILGRRNPIWVAVAAVGFGVAQALQLSIQAGQGGVGAIVPYELFAALPYILAVVAILIAREGRQSAQPAALGIPYRKEASNHSTDE